jgi:hypothetical protein
MKLTRSTTLVVFLACSSLSLAAKQHPKTRGGGRQLPAEKKDKKKKDKKSDKAGKGKKGGTGSGSGSGSSTGDRTGGAGTGIPGIGDDGLPVFQVRDPLLVEKYACVDISAVLLPLQPAAETCNGSCAQNNVGCCRVANGVMCDEDNQYTNGAPVSIAWVLFCLYTILLLYSRLLSFGWILNFIIHVYSAFATDGPRLRIESVAV